MKHTKLITIRVSEQLLKALRDLKIDISKDARIYWEQKVKKTKKAS